MFRSIQSMLRAIFFGTSQIYLQGIPLSHRLVGKELALFAYLASHKELCPRAKLLDLLWADVNEQKARENLRSLIYSLRQTIGDYLIVTRQAVGLNRQLPYWLDVEVFLSLPAQLGAQDPFLWSEVLRLYHQDFLDGFSISNAPVFDAWIAEQRDQLRTQAVAGWRQLVSFYQEREQYEEALAANQRLLALAPWSEEAHHQQMQLLSATGQRSAALAQYELCRLRLQDEFDVLPSHETVNLYNTIRAQSDVLPTVTLLPAVQPNKERLVPPSPSASPPAASGHFQEYRGTLVAPSAIWGYQYELLQLQQWVLVERCRCVAVVGLAGEGKSTLVHQLLQQASANGATPLFAGVVVFSCRSPLPFPLLLKEWLDLLGGRPSVPLPATLDRQLDLLAQHLQQHAFLWVLEDFDCCFAADGWASPADRLAFWQLWRLFGERSHRCTLLVTARKWPSLHGQTETPGRFRRLALHGLEQDAGRQLLKSHGLQGSQADFDALHQACAGNPLALKLAAQTIDELFEGCVAAFLQEQALLVGELAALLEQQLSDLTPLEGELLNWLALAGTPLSSQQLWDLLVMPPASPAYFTALQSLLRACLLDIHDGWFQLRNLQRAYLCCQLSEQLFQELYQSVLTLQLTGETLHRYRLAVDDASQVQEPKNFAGLSVEPLLARLQRCMGKERLVAALLQLVAALEQQPGSPPCTLRSYALENLTSLLAFCSRPEP